MITHTLQIVGSRHMMKVENIKRAVNLAYSDQAYPMPHYYVRRNAERHVFSDLSGAQEAAARNASALLVGSGSSLDAVEMRPLLDRGAVVFAVDERTVEILNDAGIVPYFLPDIIHSVLELGFRDLHLHGYDGSGEKLPITLQYGNRKFRTDIFLLRQTELFVNRDGPMIEERGGDITIYGDGLLQCVLREMMQPSTTPVNLVELDLERNPPCWDFFTFLMAADMERRQAGCTEPLRIRLKNVHE